MVKNSCSTVSQLIDKLVETGKKYDIEKIRQAGDYAESLHEGQFRVSGEPYISHPVAVAEIVIDLGLDTNSICAALLHDTVEDCSDKTDLSEIEKRFGKEVALLVDGLTKIPLLNIEDKEEAQIENIRKMLLAMSKDIRVIFIKLCDRLHNIRTLDAKSEEKRRATALETMHVYAPLAHRLGMRKLKHELEDRCISYLDPIGYKEIESYTNTLYGAHGKILESVQKQIKERLLENDITCEITGRIKTIYSIYRKMNDQDKNLNEIYDYYAMRIIVDNESECYTALGIIHEMFKSVPGRFKDYISIPKANMYRSVHTTVMGKEGIPFEVQIRTWEMHHVAEYGICAHWKYKSGEGTKSRADVDKKLEWISKLIETESNTTDPDEFFNALKTDVFQDDTFIFTPKGDIITLAQGSTVIDFAYAIHSGVGHSMVGAKINGKIVPIDRVPKTGDILEIITSSSSKGPSRDWIKIAKTSSARSKIRSFFKKEKRSENIVTGKNMVDAEFKKFTSSSTEQQRAEIVENISQRMGYMTADDLYNDLGYGGLAYSKIEAKIRDEYERTFGKVYEVSNADDISVENIKLAIPKNVKANGGVIVDGLDGCLVKFAKCCTPLPGDSIIGYITRGHGVSVHNASCQNILVNRSNPENNERWVNVHWANTKESQKELYEAQLGIMIYDRTGILSEIVAALSDMKVQLLQINTNNVNELEILINIKISCKNVDHYHSIVSRLRSIEGVRDIRRGMLK
ncbi:MAG: bifunctional (p)ppGpp synthetase/guanosine-3',5'-bis(diphosphate) 3'-pyrophosphohydrolase [Ruminococcaceae bacterium]|nr:bifunctional (p)ppGpp synthetase/guanosine-3',5'-bis(diphosphate) 3'-pyrophosphohydrolase [Oscillospiraceae bacterium]